MRIQESNDGSRLDKGNASHGQRMNARPFARSIGLCALALFLACTAASAHMMPARQGTINLQGDSAYCVVSIPISAFSRVDDDGDGLLSVVELTQHVTDIKPELTRRLRLYDGEQIGKVEFVQVSIEPEEQSTGSNTVLVLIKIRFTEPPQSVRIETDLFGLDPDNAGLTIKALRGKETEKVVLGARKNVHRFFSPTWRTRLEDALNWIRAQLRLSA